MGSNVSGSCSELLLSAWSAKPRSLPSPLYQDKVTYFWLHLCSCWRDFDKTWQEASTNHHLRTLWYVGQSVNKYGTLVIYCWDIFNFSGHLQLRNKFWWNLTGSKFLTSFSNVVYMLRVDPSTMVANLASDLPTYFFSPLLPQWNWFWRKKNLRAESN